MAPMSGMDICVGAAAVITGLASLARRGAPFAARWRLRLAVAADVVMLSAATFLVAADPGVLLETPLALIVGLGLVEAGQGVLDLRRAVGRPTPRWLA